MTEMDFNIATNGLHNEEDTEVNPVRVGKAEARPFHVNVPVFLKR